MILLARIKKILCPFIPMIEFCHRCGARQELVWRADNATWWLLTGWNGGVFCPSCFNKMAVKHFAGTGKLVRWHVTVE